MQNFFRALLSAVAAALLVSCGGGSVPADAPAAAPPLRALALVRPVDATSLMDWAEGRYSQYFSSHQPNQQFGPYDYRYYGAGIYLGVNRETQEVVVMGVLGTGIVAVGHVADYACNVFPENCPVPSGPVIAGVAAKGPLNNADVSVFNLNADGSKGGLLASSTTGTDGTGRFSVPLPGQPAGPVVVEVSGGTYSSAYDGSTVTSQNKMSTMLRSVSATGESGVSVNPLSDMVASLTRTYLGQRYSVPASLDVAEKWVAWQYGLKTAPSRIIPKFTVSAASTDGEAVHLALVLAALDTLGKRLSPSNPDAIFASLSADFADGVFDGRSATGQPVSLNASALPAGAGSSEFAKAFATTFSGTTAGWRPKYLDAHISAGTIAENYQARIIPVYVAEELKPYFAQSLVSPLPKTTSLDTTATGYSCPAGALTFDSGGHARCGSYSTCSGGATLVTINGREACSDGGIPIFHAAEIPVYTAPTIVPYTASTIDSYLATPTIGAPAAGTIPIFRATAVHVLTQAERDAMMANDRLAGDAAAAKVSALGTPTALQMEWLNKINDAVIASVSH